MNEFNSRSQKPDSKVALLALSSMVMGVVSICPSLGIIDSIRNPQSTGDFQGGGIIFMFIIFGLTLLSPASVITGILALYNIVENKKEKMLMIPAIIGTLLGLPGIVSLIILFSAIGP